MHTCPVIQLLFEYHLIAVTSDYNLTWNHRFDVNTRPSCLDLDYIQILIVNWLYRLKPV